MVTELKKGIWNWFTVNKEKIRTVFAIIGGFAFSFLVTVQAGEMLIKGFEAPAILNKICIYTMAVCGGFTGVPYLVKLKKAFQ